MGFADCKVECFVRIARGSWNLPPLPGRVYFRLLPRASAPGYYRAGPPGLRARVNR